VIPKARVVLGASGFFVTSFLMSGNGNVLPQLFFQRFHPEHKVTYLAICLFVGTIGGISGVLASRRTALGTMRASVLVLVTLGAEASLFLLEGALPYVALNAVAQVGANYLTNQIDHAAAASGSDRRLHDGVSNVARLLGILAAPAFFTRFIGRTPAILGALGAISVLAIACVASLARPENDRRVATSPASVPLGSADRLVFGYAAAVYVALYLFAANLIYLLRDVVRLEDAVRRGGTAIVVVFFSALVTNGLTAMTRRGEAIRPLVLAAPVFVLPPCAFAISRGVSLPFGVVLAGCAVVGSTYGFFLAELRDWVSRGARTSGKTELLTLFNNLGNVSSLVAFGVMAVLAVTFRGSPRTTEDCILGIIGILPVAALPLLFTSSLGSNRG
jgi:hypothetical protein